MQVGHIHNACSHDHYLLDNFKVLYSLWNPKELFVFAFELVLWYLSFFFDGICSVRCPWFNSSLKIFSILFYSGRGISAMCNTNTPIALLSISFSEFTPDFGDVKTTLLNEKMLLGDVICPSALHLSTQNVLMLMIHLRKRSARWVTYE